MNNMEITIIPPKRESRKKLRVCAYCRVSSEHDEQLTSAENQIAYYTKLISDNPRYELVGIYCDKGISGIKENRPEFQRMLRDARAGRIDLILTKSISRFSRNTNTMLKAVRELQELGIGVFFELQNINTLDMGGELLISVYSAFAQAESENTSDLLELSHLRRVKQGNNDSCLLGLYGYSKNENGEYVPDDNAVWVKQIFNLASKGVGPTYIAKYLNELGVKPKNTTSFSRTVIEKILNNPSYKGEIVRKNYWMDSDGSVHRNDGSHPSLVVKNNHPAIISQKLWEWAHKNLPPTKKELQKMKMDTDMNLLRDKCSKMKGRIYCGECGYVMHAAISKRDMAASFRCYGQGRFGISFCPAHSVPLRFLEDIKIDTDKLYVFEYQDKYGRKRFRFEPENEWKKYHEKKKKSGG